MHLDATQASFLSRLGKSPEGQQLLVLISAEIESCNEQLRKQTGEGLLREQGKALYLDELKHRLMFDASARLEKRRPTPFDSTA
jgi:hypothetical protein